MKTIPGFTLIELMIVLMISVSLLLWASAYWSVLGRVETAKRLNRDAAIILESMNQFYTRHCSKVDFPSINIAILQREKILVGSGSFNNPWGGDFQLSIINVRSTNAQMRISAVFDTVVDAEYVAGFSGKAIAEDTKVVWKKNSSLNRTVEGINKQLDREIFGTSLC